MARERPHMLARRVEGREGHSLRMVTGQRSPLGLAGGRGKPPMPPSASLGLQEANLHAEGGIERVLPHRAPPENRGGEKVCGVVIGMAAFVRGRPDPAGLQPRRKPAKAGRGRAEMAMQFLVWKRREEKLRRPQSIHARRAARFPAAREPVRGKATTEVRGAVADIPGGAVGQKTNRESMPARVRRQPAAQSRGLIVGMRGDHQMNHEGRP